jgi:ketosteroid isomerase-like protein
MSERRRSDSNRRPFPSGFPLTGICQRANSLLLYHAELRRRETMGKAVGSKTLLASLNPQFSPQPLMEPSPSDADRKAVEATIVAFFEAGKNKDLGSLPDFHSSRDTFTKFDENPPYTRQNSEEAFVHEQAAFANISDYTYKLDDLRVDLVGDAAVATFYLTYKGMFVNDYSFEGSPVASRARVTMVLARTPRGWRIAHEHFSRFPDWVSTKGEPSK